MAEMRAGIIWIIIAAVFIGGLIGAAGIFQWGSYRFTKCQNNCGELDVTTCSSGVPLDERELCQLKMDLAHSQCLAQCNFF